MIPLRRCSERALTDDRPKGPQGHTTAACADPTIREKEDARWDKAHPDLVLIKRPRHLAGKSLTITSLHWGYGNSLIKDFSSGVNKAPIATSGDFGVILKPIKDLVARRCFTTYCIAID